MAYTRQQLNFISVRQQAVRGKQYVDEFGVTYIGNHKGRLEKVQGASTTSVSDLNQSLQNAVNSISSSTVTPVTPVTVEDFISPLLLMGA